MTVFARNARFAFLGQLLRQIGLCAALATSLAACGGDPDAKEVKSLKEQVQRATGQKDFRRVADLSEKGLALAQKVKGPKAPDTLYFAQGVSEGYRNLRNPRAAATALRREIDMRAAAGQAETKLQSRRTLLIQIAEENGDKSTAADQALAVSKGIKMGPGKDPQPVYRTLTDYPPEQFRAQTEGDVEIDYSIDATGVVTSARVTKATPVMVFDQAALGSFRKWRFTPMLDQTGQAVSASNLKFTLCFRLNKPGC